MNIFENYLDILKKILLDLSKKGDLILPDNMDGITCEIPPSKFKSDISTNVAMVLSKINKKSPMELGKVLADQIKKSDQKIDKIEIMNPGFINIKFKPMFWTTFIEQIKKIFLSFEINLSKKKIIIW